MRQKHNSVFFSKKSRFKILPLCFPSNKQVILAIFIIILNAVLLFNNKSVLFAEEKERETIKMRVVAVNPSSTREQVVPVKIYLPEEVTPKDIVGSRDLKVEYDDSKGMYYASREDVLLKPKETRIFEVEVKDVWIVPQDKLKSLGEQTTFVLKRLEGSEFYEGSKILADAIFSSLDIIARTQNDETVGRKQHIGIYRNNMKLVEEIERNIDRLERQLTLLAALPVPEVLEQDKIKSDSPTKTTTWMIIFIIIIFVGMLGGVFFFTWHSQARSTKDFITGVRKKVFPKGDSLSDQGETKDK